MSSVVSPVSVSLPPKPCIITVVAEGANTKLTIDHDGTGALKSLPPKPCSVVFVLVVVSILAALLPFIVFLPSKLPP
jgi:hypothetical protein